MTEALRVLLCRLTIKPPDPELEALRVLLEESGPVLGRKEGSAEVTDPKDYLEALEEIERWKAASGLEDSHGDPDGITPEAARRHWEGVDARVAELEAEADEACGRHRAEVLKLERMAFESAHAALDAEARVAELERDLAGADEDSRAEADIAATREKVVDALRDRVAELERELGRVLMWCDEPAKLLSTVCDSYATGLRAAKKQVRELVQPSARKETP